jgi:hypothetical protein
MHQFRRTIRFEYIVCYVYVTAECFLGPRNGFGAQGSFGNREGGQPRLPAEPNPDGDLEAHPVLAPAPPGYRARPKKSSPKTASNRRTLYRYRKSQRTPISSPRLVSPMKLGPARSTSPALARTWARARQCSACAARIARPRPAAENKTFKTGCRE